MSFLKINEEQALFKEELNRLVQFLSEEGFRKLFLNQTSAFGLFRKSNDVTFLNGRVLQGTLPGTIKINSLLAFNEDGNVLYQDAKDNLQIIQDSNYYWIKIKHAYSSIEKGTVSIDVNGNLVGDNDCKFKDVLRKGSVVRFYDTLNNQFDYPVISVSSNQQAVIGGFFVNETNLRYAVVGTFSEGYDAPDSSKLIYNYDSATISLVSETTFNQRPYLSGENVSNTFFLARVRNVDGVIEIQDKRSEIWLMNGKYELSEIDQNENFLIGVTDIKWDSEYSAKDRNFVTIQWALTSLNWSFNSSLNIITLNSGSGGRFADITQIAAGALNGWKLYVEKQNRYFTVIQSTLSGNQINLLLDNLDVDFFQDSSQTLIIVPNAESIEFFIQPVNSNISPIREEFPINCIKGIIQLPVFANPTCQYKVFYRYKNFKHTTRYFQITGTDLEYLSEVNYNTLGNRTTTSLLNPVYQIYNDSVITLTISPKNIQLFKDRIDTGDLIGVSTFSLNEGEPVKTLQVGQNAWYSRIITPETGRLTTTIDLVINLSTAGAKNGNRFYIQMFQLITLGTGSTLTLNQDYVNPDNVGTVLFIFSQDILDSLVFVSPASGNNSGLFLSFIYDGSKWQLEGTDNFVRRTDSPTNEPYDLDQVKRDALLRIQQPINGPGGAGNVFAFGHDLIWSQLFHAWNNNENRLFFRTFNGYLSSPGFSAWAEVAKKSLLDALTAYTSKLNIANTFTKVLVAGQQVPVLTINAANATSKVWTGNAWFTTDNFLTALDDADKPNFRVDSYIEGIVAMAPDTSDNDYILFTLGVDVASRSSNVSFTPTVISSQAIIINGDRTHTISGCFQLTEDNQYRFWIKAENRTADNSAANTGNLSAFWPQFRIEATKVGITCINNA